MVLGLQIVAQTASYTPGLVTNPDGSITIYL